MINDSNLIILDGGLATDPVLRYTPDKRPVCDLYIVNNIMVRNRQTVTRAKVTLWNDRALWAAEELHKGYRIRIKGSIVEDNYKSIETDQETKGRLKIDYIQEITILRTPKKELKEENISV